MATQVKSPQIVDDGTLDLNIGTRRSPIYDNGNSGAAATIDFNNEETQKITLTANCTLTFSNTAVSDYLSLQLIQDGTGGFSVTWPSGTKAPGGTITTSSGANEIDWVGIRVNAASDYHVVAISNDIQAV